MNAILWSSPRRVKLISYEEGIPLAATTATIRYEINFLWWKRIVTETLTQTEPHAGWCDVKGQISKFNEGLNRTLLQLTKLEYVTRFGKAL